jgi:CheY-like chemotaxis protein
VGDDAARSRPGVFARAWAKAVSGTSYLPMTQSQLEEMLQRLTDLGMPRMDGLELTRAIRRHSELADTPIVMLSGHLHPGDGQPTAAGVCAVLLKPCPNDKLRAVVQDLLDRGPHAHDDASASCPAHWPVTA